MKTILLLILCMILGCSAPQSSSPPNGEYRTITADPRRDTDAAIKANQEGLVRLGKNQIPQAIECFNAALTADVSFGPAHNNLGKAYYAYRDYYKAAWEFEYAIKLMPNQSQPRNNLGLVYENVDKLDEAIANYDEALKLDANNPQYLGNAARARVRRGDKTHELRELLSKLILHDTRQDWINWARQTLVFMGAPASQPATNL